jgi:exodeoxyribonuclease VII small subunit
LTGGRTLGYFYGFTLPLVTLTAKASFMATNSNTIPDPDPASATAPSFEAALAELEGIVAAMEAGKMPLQDALDAYKRGVALLRQCQSTLIGGGTADSHPRCRWIARFDATAQRDGTGRGGEQDA